LWALPLLGWRDVRGSDHPGEVLATIRESLSCPDSREKTADEGIQLAGEVTVGGVDRSWWRREARAADDRSRIAIRGEMDTLALAKPSPS
jgi:hypothetical protein